MPFYTNLISEKKKDKIYQLISFYSQISKKILTNLIYKNIKAKLQEKKR